MENPLWRPLMGKSRKKKNKYMDPETLARQFPELVKVKAIQEETW